MSTYVAVLALVLAYVALVGVYCALRTLARLRRATTVLARGGAGSETIVEATERHIALTGRVAEQLNAMRAEFDAATSAAKAAASDAGKRAAVGPDTGAAAVRAEAERIRADAQRAAAEAQRAHAEAQRMHDDAQRAHADRMRTERDEIARLQAERAALAEQVATLHADAARSMRNVALVRYDAFDDIAGRMSFSMALLDDRGDGVALTAIAGRSDTRVYAKGVTGGSGENELSPEERQAVTAALGRRVGRRELRPPRRRAS